MNIQDITAALIQYKYIIMFLLMFVEGPIVGFISAFLAAKGYFNFGIVYVLSITGDVAGDLLWYRVGRRGRQLGIKHISNIEGKRNLISKKALSWASHIGDRFRGKLEKMENNPIMKYLERNTKKRFFLSLFIVKMTPPLSIPGQFSFGFLKVSFWKFLLQTTLVCFLFESIFLNLGYFSSISISTFKNNFDRVTEIISSIAIVLLALLIGFLIIKRFKSISKRLK